MTWLRANSVSVTHTGVAAAVPTSSTVNPMTPSARTIFRSTLLSVATLISRSQCLKKSTTARALCEWRARNSASSSILRANWSMSVNGGALAPPLSTGFWERPWDSARPVDVVVHDHAAGRRIAVDPLDARYRRERLGDLLQQFGIALGGRDFHANPARHLMGDVEFELGHGLVSQPMTAAPGASRRGHGRTRRGFGCGSLFVAFGVDLRDNVMHVLLGLSDHFAGFLPHLVGAPDRRLDQGTHGPAEPRQVFRDQQRGDAEHKAGQQGSLENDHTGANHRDRGRGRDQLVLALG